MMSIALDETPHDQFVGRMSRRRYSPMGVQQEIRGDIRRKALRFSALLGLLVQVSGCTLGDFGRENMAEFQPLFTGEYLYFFSQRDVDKYQTEGISAVRKHFENKHLHPEDCSGNVVVKRGGESQNDYGWVVVECVDAK